MNANRFRVSSALREIIINTGWLFTLRVLRIAAALFVTVWVARYLGPSRFGTLSYAFAFVALFWPLSRLGLDWIVLRDLVREPAGRDEILGTTFILRFVGGVACLAAALIVISVVRPGDSLMRVLTAIVAFGVIFQAFEAIELWFQSQIQAKYGVYARSAALALATAAKVVLILAGAPLVAFAWVSALEIAAAAAGLVVIYRLRGYVIGAWRASVARARGLLHDSWPMMLSVTLTNVYLKIDQVMLGQFLGQEEVGIYSTAVKISEVWYYVPVAIMTSVFPSLIKGRETGGIEYERRWQQVYDFLVWIALVVALALTFTGRPLVRVLFGEAYERGGLILSVHIWASIFVFMKEALGKWIVNEGLMILLFVINGVGAVVNVVLNLVLIPRYGGMGAAAATVVSYAAGGYLACFFHPGTRGVARMMSKALAVPVRAVRGRSWLPVW